MTKADTASPIEITVFDFDGTITTDDTFRLFLRYYAGTPKWALNILLLLPIFIGYGLKIVDRNQAKIHVMRRFFKNAPVTHLNQRAARLCQRGYSRLDSPSGPRMPGQQKRRA